MSNRRSFLLSAGCAVAAAVLSRAAQASNYTKDVDNGLPKGTIVPGKPPVLDFGNSFKVPLGKDALGTLWEGPDMWLTFGMATAAHVSLAMRDAANSAEGTMKLMLLTLAFAPERMEKVEDCGWRVKSGDFHDLVMGDIALPGHPFMPVIDTDHPANTARTMGYPSAFTGFILLKKDVDLDYVRGHGQVVSGSG